MEALGACLFASIRNCPGMERTPGAFAQSRWQDAPGLRQVSKAAALAGGPDGLCYCCTQMMRLVFEQATLVLLVTVPSVFLIQVCP